jgi:hypothetical protein
LDEKLKDALARHSIKDAAALVADETGRPRRAVYARALSLARAHSGDEGTGSLLKARQKTNESRAPERGTGSKDKP